MQVYTYSWFWKLIYRYANIVVSVLLVFYLIPLAVNLDKNLLLLLPFIISLFLIYFVNKSYFVFYKLVPYKINADNEKIVCSDFFFRKKTITIYYKDIESLTGGIFEARYRGLMKVCDGKNKICIGFFDKMINSNKLITIILSKVDKKLYDNVISKLEEVKLRRSKKTK
ncbi:MAG TPA: hypothetical protein PK073_03480 [Ignavibacteriaceae bacterium]|jgi:hypothetical protein|nr:MAG: hypothetical protein BWY38_02548 [Ignavibacteria bacterium ADurb.Bin266]OQY72846.1 MAG: hypothetical protein B6D44_08985 [Ignavibacteriales bacterium UTCHB2]HQF41950.1 hypothetical protein [Ignavibacteriaceae bacterium]HQI41478.1 hypothetical protein [Ignavibacteriaceae bacterium]HQJ46277.1 hypothetical protein [Ignavibacteriaceae bacterium]